MNVVYVVLLLCSAVMLVCVYRQRARALNVLYCGASGSFGAARNPDAFTSAASGGFLAEAGRGKR